MQAFLLVGAGGALGAMLRYGVSSLAGRVWPTPFPHATLFVNVAGSLAMGLLVGILARTLPPMQSEIRLFVAIGVLGGFTTFSSFSLDVISLVERGQWGQSVLYIVLSVALSVMALFAGLLVARMGA